MTSSATREYPTRPNSEMPLRGTPGGGRRGSPSRELSTFGLLPEPEGRNGAFTVSLIINVTVIALILVLSIVMVHRQVLQRRMDATQLLLPVTPPPRVRPVVRPAVHIVPPTPDLLNRIAPKITYVRTTTPEAQPKMAKVRLNNMAAPVLPPYRPDSVEAPPQPKVGMFHANIPTAVANNQAPTSTKTGGFGDPMGVHANPSASRPANVAAYGSFQSSIGSESGAGAARPGKVGGTDFGSGYANGVPGGGGSHGKVASGGFSTAIGAAGNTPRGTVKQGSFQDNVNTAAPKLALANTQSNETNVQVISHPTPEYTAEAKQLKIQGEVVLEVRFSADGQVHVIRVVRGLGHGLDQEAIRAAEQTHFKPATRDGKPVDKTTYYRIDFQLA